MLLKNAFKKLIVYGVGQTDETNNVDYDYIGVMYPEGNIGEGTQFLFNHLDIDEVFFRGFENEERDEFIEKLQTFFEGSEE